MSSLPPPHPSFTPNEVPLPLPLPLNPEQVRSGPLLIPALPLPPSPTPKPYPQAPPLRPEQVTNSFGWPSRDMLLQARHPNPSPNLTLICSCRLVTLALALI